MDRLRPAAWTWKRCCARSRTAALMCRPNSTRLRDRPRPGRGRHGAVRPLHHGPGHRPRHRPRPVADRPAPPRSSTERRGGSCCRTWRPPGSGSATASPRTGRHRHLAAPVGARPRRRGGHPGADGGTARLAGDPAHGRTPAGRTGGGPGTRRHRHRGHRPRPGPGRRHPAPCSTPCPRSSTAASTTDSSPDSPLALARRRDREHHRLPRRSSGWRGTAGRSTWCPAPTLSGTLGWFTAMYPVRLDLRASTSTTPSPAARPPARRSRPSRNSCGPCPTTAWATACCATQPGDRSRPSPDCGSRRSASTTWAAPPAPTSPRELRGLSWTPDTTHRDLIAAPDADLPVLSALEINAVATGTPDGDELTAYFGFPTGVLTRDEVTELAGLWVEALTAPGPARHHPRRRRTDPERRTAGRGGPAGDRHLRPGSARWPNCGRRRPCSPGCCSTPSSPDRPSTRTTCSSSSSCPATSTRTACTAPRRLPAGPARRPARRLPRPGGRRRRPGGARHRDPALAAPRPHRDRRARTHRHVRAVPRRGPGHPLRRGRPAPDPPRPRRPRTRQCRTRPDRPPRPARRLVPRHC